MIKRSKVKVVRCSYVVDGAGPPFGSHLNIYTNQGYFLLQSYGYKRTSWLALVKEGDVISFTIDDKTKAVTEFTNHTLEDK